ncbi:urease accessory protein UreF [Gordonia amicalis]|uniref:urease accessory protein UreF n=1 Tax=Gordonia amicalis TaxID=89053 RepID=UPI0002A62746|nr:urease accessory UreF family protein [Gordonia amicalis]MBA5847888.1 urease accessory protein UreF [Gordonia amicalis]MDV7174291.1 urease accessory UreF family protein [Gordonia amicalis]NKX77640.1 urease accessory protein UreF [Gordonia amicalis]UOG21825.1 urease accessory protein UreF [Gordonia amicalis]GAC52489.1 urease accessory protein UreF [Gordonia amicalis NBRC 100051 = JCM 11271]
MSDRPESSPSSPAHAPLAMMLSLADSRLPVGGHVHSGGVEQAIADGFIRTATDLADFLYRRVTTSGLVAASAAAAVADGALEVGAAQREVNARTPSAAARKASLAQGRGMVRLARRMFPDHDWTVHRPATHLPVISGSIGAASSLSGFHTALILVYTTMSGSATAGQRLLALDPADVSIMIADLGAECERVAAEAAVGLADLSDPVLDIFAERHERQSMPLFMS